MRILEIYAGRPALVSDFWRQGGSECGSSSIRSGGRRGCSWGGTCSDEVDDFEVGRANCTHMALIITLERDFQKELREIGPHSPSRPSIFTFSPPSPRVFVKSTLEFPYRFIFVLRREIFREKNDEW